MLVVILYANVVKIQKWPSIEVTGDCLSGDKAETKTKIYLANIIIQTASIALKAPHEQPIDNVPLKPWPLL